MTTLHAILVSQAALFTLQMGCVVHVVRHSPPPGHWTSTVAVWASAPILALCIAYVATMLVQP